MGWYNKLFRSNKTKTTKSGKTSNHEVAKMEMWNTETGDDKKVKGVAINKENLLDAAQKGDISTVKALLAKGADVNAKNNNGGTVLMYASNEDHIEVVRELLAKGADVNAKNNKNNAALMKALEDGRIEEARNLVVEGLVVEGIDETTLIMACAYGHIEVVRELLNYIEVANVNVKDSMGGGTALMWASRNGYIEVVKKLLSRGADVNVRNNYGGTALTLAFDKNHIGVIEELKRAGA